MYAYRRTYEKTIYRFLTAFYKIKKIYFWPRGAPCSAGALGLGLAGLCLKTALGFVSFCAAFSRDLCVQFALTNGWMCVVFCAYDGLVWSSFALAQMCQDKRME